MPNSARWLLAVSALAVAAAGTPVTAAVPTCPSGAFRVSKRWVEVDLPKLPRAVAVPNDRVMTNYAVDATAVTALNVPYNGARHLRSDFAAKPALSMATDHNLYRYLG